MDNKKVAMYLAGKIPEYYLVANKSRFVRLTRKFFPDFVTEIQLIFIEKQCRQAEDFYYLILDDIYKDFGLNENFQELLNQLQVPKEIYKN